MLEGLTALTSVQPILDELVANQREFGPCLSPAQTLLLLPHPHVQCAARRRCLTSWSWLKPRTRSLMK